MANETDPVKKEAIGKEINELTIEAGKVSVSNEFSNLMESMGGKNLNAATGMDLTFYHNSFPTFRSINGWRFHHSVSLIRYSVLSNLNWRLYTKNTIAGKTIRDAYNTILSKAKPMRGILMHVQCSVYPNI